MEILVLLAITIFVMLAITRFTTNQEWLVVMVIADNQDNQKWSLLMPAITWLAITRFVCVSLSHTRVHAHTHAHHDSETLNPKNR